MALLATPAPAQTPATCTSSSPAVSFYVLSDNFAGIVKDCNTLLGLKDELSGGSRWVNWSAHTPPIQQWTGIGIRDDRVTDLVLHDYYLSGSIPPELGQLTSLTTLWLSENGDLSGSIPPELGQLTSLTTLWLFSNDLSGSIPPELGQLTNLTKLGLHNDRFCPDCNDLSGSIPPELGQLTRLTELWLSRNDLSGSIPPELGQLTSLTRLDLLDNDLSGLIPPELGQLTRLTELWLSSNDLSGSIPPELGQLTSLTELRLRNNDLSGSIPPELGQLTRLWRDGLDLRDNRLSGCIPRSLSGRISRINPQQGGIYLPVCLPTGLPGPPTGLSATPGDGQVTLTWTAPSGTVTKYQIRQSSDAGSTYGAWKDASGTATTHTVTGLTNGAAYTFQVRGVNADGNGAASASVTATPVGEDNEAVSRTLPLVLSASYFEQRGQRGFVRIINRSDASGEVRIHAIDDAGERFGPVTLSLDAWQARHFNSADLEEGNPAKGLSGGVGNNGSGHWRLVLDTALDIEALAYIRTSDGFVTSMHEVAAQEGEGTMRYRVPFFNPGSNDRQRSRLRLVNPGESDADIVLSARDDRGAPSESEVRLTLPAGEARTLSAQALEAGGSEFAGRFGDGAGKWRVWVTAERAVQVMSLLESPTGNLTNLSGPGAGMESVSPP